MAEPYFDSTPSQKAADAAKAAADELGLTLTEFLLLCLACQARLTMLDFSRPV